MGWTHWLLSWALWIVEVVAIVIVIAILAIPIAPEQWVWMKPIRQWAAVEGKALGVVLVTIVGLCRFISKYIVEPWKLRCIKGILSAFQRNVFSSVDDLSDHHRVTLYRFHQFCLFTGWRCSGKSLNPWGKGNWPFSGWLVPIVRAGPDSAPTTIFLASDAVNFEGVCGATYFQQQTVVEKKIADLPNITNESEDADIEEYARQTWVRPEMIKARIKKRRPCARWYLAIRVEVQYKKWGVLMIDSRNDTMPQTHYKAMSERLDQIKEVLSHLLKV